MAKSIAKKQIYEGYAGRTWKVAEERVVLEDRRFAVEAENWTEAATLILGEFMKSYTSTPSRRANDTFYVRDIKTAEDIASQRGVSLDRLAIRNGAVVVEPEKPEPRIDSDVPWYEEHNQDAARKLGVRWNGRGYVDSDGCQILDKYGQPLG